MGRAEAAVVAAGVALAAALPELPWACGLGTLALLEGDVVVDPAVQHGGVLSVSAEPPQVDEALVARWSAEPERVAWWTERVAAAYAHLLV